MNDFTHINTKGHVQMVDVTDKEDTDRAATAGCNISMNKETLKKILDNTTKKGNVFETARIAGIMAAKKTHALIPMCHPLIITAIEVKFSPILENSSISIESTVRLKGKTGVEMEALTAVSIAALTIYDMCKSYDRCMEISDICLLKKSGGKSGIFKKNIS